MVEVLVGRFDRLKLKAKERAPEILMAVTSILGTAGWIMAGIYAERLRQNEMVDAQTDGWPTIKISPSAMEDIRNGATLMYRQRKVSPSHLYTQHTTRSEFSDEMNERFADPIGPEF